MEGRLVSSLGLLLFWFQRFLWLWWITTTNADSNELSSGHRRRPRQGRQLQTRRQKFVAFGEPSGPRCSALATVINATGADDANYKRGDKKFVASRIRCSAPPTVINASYKRGDTIIRCLREALWALL